MNPTIILAAGGVLAILLLWRGSAVGGSQSSSAGGSAQPNPFDAEFTPASDPTFPPCFAVPAVAAERLARRKFALAPFVTPLRRRATFPA